MWKLALLLCSALLAFGADDPWAKVRELKTGAELRVYKKGAAQPLLVQMGELTDDNLVVIDKKEQTAIARDLIERVDCRPSGKSRVTKETTTKEVVGPDGPTSSTNSGVSIGSKPEFETVYRRPPSPPKK
jgi:hypothetical protein